MSGSPLLIEFPNWQEKNLLYIYKQLWDFLYKDVLRRPKRFMKSEYVLIA